MENAKPIETNLGILRGRDCIYLDSVCQDDNGNLRFSGEINGELVIPPNKNNEWIPYKLTFQCVIAYFACELDTYISLGEAPNYKSSFDLIEDSQRLRSFPIREDYDKKEYKHYRLYTYDDVYDIIATSYQFEADI